MPLGDGSQLQRSVLPECIGWSGALDVLVPALPPGGTHVHAVLANFTERGAFRIYAELRDEAGEGRRGGEALLGHQGEGGGSPTPCASSADAPKLPVVLATVQVDAVV